MKKRIFTLVLVVVSLLGSDVFALTVMGPPVSELRQGQYAASIDYIYSKTNFRLNQGNSPGGGPSFTLEDVKMNFLYGKVGYGVSDNLDIYILAGGGSARGDDSSKAVSIDFDGDNGYGIGFGTKATLHENANIKCGAMFQIYWAETDGRAYNTSNGTRWNADLDIYEMQIAAGAIGRVNENISIYGGPFIHQFDGDFDAKNGGTKISYDIDEAAWFGGYIGSQINVAANVYYNIEYQHTAAANALGMSLMWKF